MIRKIERENLGSMKAGQDLVLAGFAGFAGTRSLVESERNTLLQWFSSEYLDEVLERVQVSHELGFTYFKEFGATEVEACGLGGILKTLWDLSGAYEIGLECILRQIPVRQETIEVCEHLGLTPYRLCSEGAYLLVTDNGEHLVRELAKVQIPAAIIGVVTDTKARILVNGDGPSFLERPKKDELIKFHRR